MIGFVLGLGCTGLLLGYTVVSEEGGRGGGLRRLLKAKCVSRGSRDCFEGLKSALLLFVGVRRSRWFLLYSIEKCYVVEVFEL